MIQWESHRSSRAFTKRLDLLTTICNQMAVVLERRRTLWKKFGGTHAQPFERFLFPEIVDLIISGESEDEDNMLSPKEKE
jgi:hypothetical protein